MRWLLILGLAIAGCTKAPAGEETDAAEDRDGDGYDTLVDCDDADGNRHPDAAEQCNDLDDDCDDLVDEEVGSTFYADGDGDGFGDEGAPVVACEASAGLTADASDCDDADPLVHPGGEESCNDVDDDCDGQTDEDVGTLRYADTDGDGYGDPASAVIGCDADGYVNDSTDCDDADAAVNPAADEACNGADDDCNDLVDDEPDSGGGTWYTDADGDGYGDLTSAITACAQPGGTVLNSEDCDDTTVDAQPGGTEVCDTYDNDCNGLVDEEAALDVGTWYYDADGDGYGSDTRKVLACQAPSAAYTLTGGDCDDADAAVNPALRWYADSDGDGYGAAASSTSSCLQPTGYVSNDDDCADGDATRSPVATETCDGVDEDCDGVVDDSPSDAETWYRDADGDGQGTAATTGVACSRPSGYAATSTDCDDADATVYLGASEYCDGADDDCDGTADESAVDAITWYRDADSDGYGVTTSTSTSCTMPTGYAATSGDCDDSSATYHPDTAWYYDADADGYGDTTTTKRQCASPGSRWVLVDGDCLATDAKSYPGAAETCFSGSAYEGKDNDCDGTSDESCPELHCGTISADETWEASPEGHYVACTTYVEGSTVPVLTVEDGAQVWFNRGASLYVGQSNYGDLVVEGTAAGVTFSSYASSPAAGDWGGIGFGQYSTGSVLEGLTIEYAQYYGVQADRAYFEMRDSTIRDTLQYGMYLQQSDALLDGVTVEGSGTYGVYGYDSALDITGSTIQDNGSYGLYCSGGACLAGDFEYNTVTGNMYPLLVPLDAVPLLSATSTYAGNTHDYVEVGYGTISTSTTWNGIDVPYRVSSGLYVDGPTSPVFTLSDGVEIEMGRYAALYVGCCSYYKGDLVVNGTSKGVKVTSQNPGTDPWYFAVAHATAATKITGLTVEGAQSGIQLTTDEAITLTDVSSDNGLWFQAYSSARTNDLTLVSSDITTSESYALYFSGDALSVDDTTIDGGDSAALRFDGTTISLTDSTVTGALGADGNAYGVALGSGAIGTWSNNVVTGNDQPMYLNDADQIFELDAASTYSGNTYDRIAVYDSSLGTSGTIPAIDAAWWFPYGLQITKSGTTSPVVYATGAEFVVGYDATYPYYQIYVSDASFYADSCTFSGYGGTSAGLWYGLYYSSTAKGSVKSSDIGYGGYGGNYNLYLGTTAVTATSNYVHHSAGYGVMCSGGCAAGGYTLTGNSYASNASGNTN